MIQKHHSILQNTEIVIERLFCISVQNQKQMLNSYLILNLIFDEIYIYIEKNILNDPKIYRIFF